MPLPPASAEALPLSDNVSELELVTTLSVWSVTSPSVARRMVLPAEAIDDPMDSISPVLATMVTFWPLIEALWL